MIDKSWVTEWATCADLSSLSIQVPLDGKIKVRDLTMEARGYRTINIGLFDDSDLIKIRDGINTYLAGIDG